MAVIGTFTKSKDGGWEGSIRTLSMTTKVRFVPNDNRETATAPDFRVLCGTSELGAAWARRAGSGEQREYLSVQLDDPSLPGPISAALFTSDDSQGANLIWNRRPRQSEE